MTPDDPIECESIELLSLAARLKADGRLIWRLDVQKPGWTGEEYRKAYRVHHLLASECRTLDEIRNPKPEPIERAQFDLPIEP